MIQSIFPIRFYQAPVSTKLDADAVEKLKTLLKQSESNNIILMKNGGVSSYHVDASLHLAPYLAPLVSELEQHAQAAWAELNYRKEFKAKISNMWVNGIVPGAYLTDHDHKQHQLSAVYHINLEPGMGNLVLHHPFENILRNSAVEASPNNYRFAVPAESGDVVIFPSYLVHNTQKNTTDQLRLSLGFDIDYGF